MARPPLPLGTWGRIRRYKTGPGTWRATTKYRDYDGVTRPVERSGSTGAKAERRLVEALRDRAKVTGRDEITAETRIKDLCALWFEGVKAKGRAGSTVDAYDDALRLHVLPALGGLRVRELGVSRADRFLTTVRDETGPSAARHARTVLNGAMALATRSEAVDHNPIRDVSPITVEQKEPRSLTLDEVRVLRKGVQANKRAVQRDIPAVVDFMLGTGLRIGEALAVTWEALDLEAGKVEVRATVVRKRGVGLVLQHKPKTRKGWRTLHLPPWLVLILRNREHVPNEWNVVFPSPLGKLRDRSNTNGDLRAVLNPLGFEWVTSHTFRKTAATLLHDGGLTVREVADQLGHKRVSMTQDTYFGRAEASPRAADVLSRLEEGDS